MFMLFRVFWEERVQDGSRPTCNRPHPQASIIGCRRIVLNAGIQCYTLRCYTHYSVGRVIRSISPGLQIVARFAGQPLAQELFLWLGVRLIERGGVAKRLTDVLVGFR